MARIASVVFDRYEQPRRATVVTRHGIVRVQWREVAGERCWFASGSLDARKLAVPVIQRIERMVSRP